MRRPLQHEILLAAAGALALGSCAWFGWQQARAVRVHRPAEMARPAAPYIGVARDAPPSKTGAWKPPGPQPRGEDWVYDVFTPPEIYYDERTGQFSVVPPLREPGAAKSLESAPAAPFGLEVLGVTRPLFRLQLVGYVGGDGTYRGVFENQLTKETFLGTKGRSLPALGLVIEDFQVRRQPVPLPDSTTTRRLVATALLRDERTGETVLLTDGERIQQSAIIAQVIVGAGARPREVRAGDQVEADGTVFRIDKIQLAPPLVDVTRLGAGQPAEQRTLIAPSATAAAVATGDGISP